MLFSIRVHFSNFGLHGLAFRIGRSWTYMRLSARSSLLSWTYSGPSARSGLLFCLDVHRASYTVQRTFCTLHGLATYRTFCSVMPAFAFCTVMLIFAFCTVRPAFLDVQRAFWTVWSFFFEIVDGPLSDLTFQFSKWLIVQMLFAF